nr:hypothetical protein [Bacteroidota bacterium]
MLILAPLGYTLTKAYLIWYALHFLWSYTNQPAHGTKPIAGVELNNVLEQIIRIGKLPGYAPNQFKNMNAGIVIHNSTLEIHNTTFRDIQPDNFTQRHGKVAQQQAQEEDLEIIAHQIILL